MAISLFAKKNKKVVSIYVLPRFQPLGVGKELLNQIMKESRYLRLTGWEKKTPAIGLYKDFGFIESGVSNFELKGKLHKNMLLTYNT